MKKQAGFLCSLLALVLSINTAFCTPTWVNINSADADSPGFSIINDTKDSLVFTIAIPGFYKEDVTYDDTTYQRLEFLNAAVLTDSGFPELPVIKEVIAVPSCDSMTVGVTYLDSVIYSNYLVYPAPSTAYSFVPSFCKDDSVYSTSSYYPSSQYEKTGVDYFRDQRLIELTVQPFFFSPDSEKVRIYDSLKVKITYHGSSGSVCEDVGIFSEAAENWIFNYTKTGGSSSGSADAGSRWVTENTIGSYDCDYLIITAEFVANISACKTEIERLADHRANFNGFEVCLISIADINAGQDWEDIRDFIESVYDDQSSLVSSDFHLPFVLLVGDAWDDDDAENNGGNENDPLIPITTEGTALYTYASDHFYADFKPDTPYFCLEDVAIGRLPVGTEDELEIIIDKIIDYETRAISPDHENWKDNIIFQLDDGSTFVGYDEAFANIVETVELSGDQGFKDFVTFYVAL